MLADELGPKGVNVTVVHPGATRTEKTASVIAARARADALAARDAEQALFGSNLIGRIVEADEVDAITGDAIAAGGGIPRAIHY